MASYVSGREPSNLGPIVILVSLVFAIGGAGAWFMSTVADSSINKSSSGEQTAKVQDQSKQTSAKSEGLM
jgi:hypothetical protein